MLFQDFSSVFQDKLNHAALQLVNEGNELPITRLIENVYQESFHEGFNHAAQILQNYIGGIKL